MNAAELRLAPPTSAPFTMPPIRLEDKAKIGYTDLKGRSSGKPAPYAAPSPVSVICGEIALTAAPKRTAPNRDTMRGGRNESTNLYPFAVPFVEWNCSS